MNKDFIYEEQKQLIEMWKNKYYEQKEKLEQLENNRDKALKYIEWQKNNPQYDNVWRKYECENLINKLKGGSDE